MVISASQASAATQRQGLRLEYTKHATSQHSKQNVEAMLCLMHSLVTSAFSSIHQEECSTEGADRDHTELRSSSNSPALCSNEDRAPNKS